MNTSLYKNIIIALLLILNILLIFKISNLIKIKNYHIKNNIDLQYKLISYKEYIIENNQDIVIDYKDIVKQISPQEGVNWIIMVPQNVCMSCITSLFSDNTNLNISKETLFLIQEQPIKSIEREWRSYNYKNYHIDSQNIFSKHNFNSQIIIIKLNTAKKYVNFLRYNPELSEFLNSFFKDVVFNIN